MGRSVQPPAMPIGEGVRNLEAGVGQSGTKPLILTSNRFLGCNGASRSSVPLGARQDPLPVRQRQYGSPE